MGAAALYTPAGAVAAVPSVSETYINLRTYGRQRMARVGLGLGLGLEDTREKKAAAGFPPATGGEGDGGPSSLELDGGIGEGGGRKAVGSE